MWRRAADAPPLAVRKGCTTLKWNRWRDVGRAGSLRGSWPIDNRPQLTKLPHRSAASLAYHLRSDASPLADESRRRPLLCRTPVRKAHVYRDRAGGGRELPRRGGRRGPAEWLEFRTAAGRPGVAPAPGGRDRKSTRLN